MLTRLIKETLTSRREQLPRIVLQSSAMTTSTSGNVKPIESSIQEKLFREFAPEHLEILNESYMHNVPKGSETHFKVVVVSNKFENTTLVQVISLPIKYVIIGMLVISLIFI